MALKGHGMPVKDVLACYGEAGFTVSPATVYSWMAAVNSGGTPMSTEKLSGAKPLLDDTQKMILAGEILTREDDAKDSHLRTYIDSAARFFSVDVSEPTASRNLADSWLTSKLMGKRSDTLSIGKEEMSKDYLDCVQDLHKSGFLSTEPVKLWCVDTVTDTQSSDRLTTFGRKGGTQRKKKRASACTQAR